MHHDTHPNIFYPQTFDQRVAPYAATIGTLGCVATMVGVALHLRGVEPLARWFWGLGIIGVGLVVAYVAVLHTTFRFLNNHDFAIATSSRRPAADVAIGIDEASNVWAASVDGCSPVVLAEVSADPAVLFVESGNVLSLSRRQRQAHPHLADATRWTALVSGRVSRIQDAFDLMGQALVSQSGEADA